MERKFIEPHSVVRVFCGDSETEAVETAAVMANSFVNDNYDEGHAYIAKVPSHFMVPLREDILGNFLLAIKQMKKQPHVFLINLRGAAKNNGIVLEDCVKVGGHGH